MEPRKGLLGKLGFKTETITHQLPDSIVKEATEEDTVDLDKAWHAIHFILTGSAWDGAFPSGFLLASGSQVGDEDVGYGPARSFSPEEVSKIHKYLSDIDPDTLKSKLDFEEMTKLEIYPSVWNDGTTIDDEWDYIGSYFRDLQAFIQKTHEDSMSLIVYIN